MKKIALCLLTLLTISCGNNQTPKEEEITYKFGVDEMYEKIWDTNIVHNETCLLTEDEDGRFSATLMFTPTKIIAVKNYSLSKDYTEEDYYIEGDKIYATENSKIMTLTKENVLGNDVPSIIGGTYASKKTESGKILFTEGSGICMYQICVTYQKEEKWKGTIPTRYGERFYNTYNKLQNGEEVVIVGYGASTLTGCNASSVLGIEPFQETFTQGFINDLKSKYSSEIIFHNLSVGGTTSVWGRENVIGVKNLVPDLVILEFGHNDACWNISTFDYEENMDFIIRACKSANPNCEIIMISSHMANPDADQYSYQQDYMPCLANLADTYDGVGICDWTTMSLDIETKKKGLDIYANNINHPSDWLVRIFATCLIEAFAK